MEHAHDRQYNEDQQISGHDQDLDSGQFACSHQVKSDHQNRDGQSQCANDNFAAAKAVGDIMAECIGIDRNRQSIADDQQPAQAAGDLRVIHFLEEFKSTARASEFVGKLAVAIGGDQCGQPRNGKTEPCPCARCLNHHAQRNINAAAHHAAGREGPGANRVDGLATTHRTPVQ